MPAPDEMESLLVSGKVDAFAANRQRIMEIVNRHPKLRILPDNFFVAGQSIAVPKGNPSTLEGLNQMLAEILGSSLVKDSINRAGLQGVDAAPPPGR
jgi:hypothetical protein